MTLEQFAERGLVAEEAIRRRQSAPRISHLFCGDAFSFSVDVAADGQSESAQVDTLADVLVMHFDRTTPSRDGRAACRRASTGKTAANPACSEAARSVPSTRVTIVAPNSESVVSGVAGSAAASFPSFRSRSCESSLRAFCKKAARSSLVTPIRLYSVRRGKTVLDRS